MRVAAKRLKQRYNKVPLFMIYLFLIARSKKIISRLIITLYILGIISMEFSIVIGVAQILNGEYSSIIFLCVCALLLLGFIVLVINDTY